jgi:hypothetical protein
MEINNEVIMSAEKLMDKHIQQYQQANQGMFKLKEDALRNAFTLDQSGTPVQMAQLTLGDLDVSGGALRIHDGESFITELGKNSVLLSKINPVMMTSDRQNLATLIVPNNPLRRPSYDRLAASANFDGRRMLEPLQTKVRKNKTTLDVYPVTAQLHLGTEILLENIEGPAVAQKMMSLFAAAIAYAVENIMLNGDTALTASPTDPSNTMALWDGFLKDAPETFDFQNDGLLPEKILAMHQRMPNNTYSNRNGKVVLMSHRNDELQGLIESVGVGNQAAVMHLMGSQYNGVAQNTMAPTTIAAMPRGTALLADTSDMFYGVSMAMRQRFGTPTAPAIEVYRDVLSNEEIMILHTKIGGTYGIGDRAVKGTNVGPATTPSGESSITGQGTGSQG